MRQKLRDKLLTSVIFSFVVQRHFIVL